MKLTSDLYPVQSVRNRAVTLVAPCTLMAWTGKAVLVPLSLRLSVQSNSGASADDRPRPFPVHHLKIIMGV